MLIDILSLPFKSISILFKYFILQFIFLLICWNALCYAVDLSKIIPNLQADKGKTFKGMSKWTAYDEVKTCTYTLPRLLHISTPTVDEK